MKIIKVEPLQDFRLLITYEGQEKRIFDMKKCWLWNKGAFLQLHDFTEFAKVQPIFDTVQWSNGLEIAPEELYDNSMSRGRG